MGEPIYTAETWADSSTRWHWRTLKDGRQVGRATMATILTAMTGVATREAAVEQARLDMEWDRDKGIETVVLNPGPPPTNPSDPDPPEERPERVVIYPRDGVTALRVQAWLIANFQRPGDEDSPRIHISKPIIDGNPLVNAHITCRDHGQ